MAALGGLLTTGMISLMGLLMCSTGQPGVMVKYWELGHGKDGWTYKEGRQGRQLVGGRVGVLISRCTDMDELNKNPKGTFRCEHRLDVYMVHAWYYVHSCFVRCQPPWKVGRGKVAGPGTGC